MTDLDLLITYGRVLDGTGTPVRSAATCAKKALSLGQKRSAR